LRGKGRIGGGGKGGGLRVEKGAIFKQTGNVYWEATQWFNFRLGEHRKKKKGGEK